jgi:hypothetical protein
VNRKFFILAGLCAQSAIAQTAVPAPDQPASDLPAIEPHIVHQPAGAQQARRIYLLPHFATTIRMPDPVQSIVLGDSTRFRGEHDENDPCLVVVHVRTEQPAETNLEITTVSGQQAILWLVSDSRRSGPVDFAVHYDAPAANSSSFWLPESRLPSVMIAKTVSLDEGGTAAREAPSDTAARPRTADRNAVLDELLKKQEQAPLPKLYGQRPGPVIEGDHLRAGISEVIDGGGTVIALFSVVNTSPHAIALLPPQVQLDGQVKKKWTTADQLPVLAYRLDHERLESGGRANGVVVFDRPSFKQAKESLFLQQAHSGAVDEPALAPIGFGISTEKGGVADYAGSAAQ